ncbi:MAG: GAF domain-containing protein, partial [Anaerolineae bacterium]|nr:GAF domain-containing protein [Anaerolineae bacterium]
LPPGMFALVYLLVLGVIMFTYVNYAPEPTSLMVKLVGISLVTLLIVFGTVSDYVLRARQRTYLELRQAELAHLQTLITTDNFTDIPADIVYVAARPVAGLFANVYQMRFARGNAPTAAQLMAHDALLREGLGQGHFPTLIAVLHENPWLETTTVAILAGNPEAIDQFLIPTAVPLYRNSSAPPVEHLMRYTLIQDETRYEVGYRYQDYRAALHQEALPFLAIQLATTLLIITVFPRFFRIGLVMPLAKLLEGVERVDHGDLQSNIPVLMEDEIGRLTHGFNQMVTSLYTSEQTLRTLNLALEKRVADRTRDLAMLYEVAALINQHYALDELLTTALHRVISGLKAAAGVIFLADTESESLRLSSVYGITPSLLSALSSLPMWPQDRKSDRALLIHDLTVDPRISTLFKPENASKSPFPYHTLVSLPIPGQEDILGVLVLFAHTPFFFNVEDLEVLNSIAGQLGIALENTRLRECAAASVVLEERQRLARDLHDSVTQVLYSQKLFADAASKSLSGGQSEHTLHYLERLGQSADYALREMRLMIYRLRPSLLASAGLCNALQRRLELVEQRAGICTHFACAIDVELPVEIEQTLYYIAEEALNNALKHAAATESHIEVVCEDAYITLSVVDNGRGFDRTSVSAGMGLQNMCERAEKVSGKCVIKSKPGAGTRVVVSIPLQSYFEETA